jgi:hypothetical protein
LFSQSQIDSLSSRIDHDVRARLIHPKKSGQIVLAAAKRPLSFNKYQYLFSGQVAQVMPQPGK